MKNIILPLLTLLCIGCSNRGDIQLNDIQVKFDDFEETDSLHFVGFYNEILEEPSEMRFYKDYLIINDLNHANNEYISIFSLKSNKVIKTRMLKGNGPNEMRSCKTALLGDNLWLYDMSKFRIGNISVDNLLNDSINPIQYNISKYYYDISMLNDTIMVGSNDLSSDKKVSFVNIKNGNIESSGDYAYLNDKVNLGALIDACNCYIDVNPKTKAISLAYRYTDVVEIYNSEGLLESSLHGPEAFGIDLKIEGSRARKKKDTRKAFVNTYATENYIYLLYSGCTRIEENWSNGTEIHVYSWQGKPVKKYKINQPIYTFAVDEDNSLIYSYSLQTGELIKAAL